MDLSGETPKTNIGSTVPTEGCSTGPATEGKK